MRAKKKKQEEEEATPSCLTKLAKEISMDGSDGFFWSPHTPTGGLEPSATNVIGPVELDRQTRPFCEEMNVMSQITWTV